MMSFWVDFNSSNPTEATKFYSALVLLVVSAWVSRFLLARWELHKKIRELDLALAADFQRRFGEFKELWRLWKQTRITPSMDYATQQILFQRACAAEAGVEAMVLKLATDRHLLPKHVQSLGLFRQSYQFLRKSIAQNLPLLYGPEQPVLNESGLVAKGDYTLAWYRVFNRVSSEVSSLVMSDGATLWDLLLESLQGRGFKMASSSEKATKFFIAIHGVREEDWQDAVREEMKPNRPSNIK